MSSIGRLPKELLPGNLRSGSKRERSPARAAAFARFAAVGLPTRRVEAWHYTDLRALMPDAAPILPAPTRADVEAARSVAR